MAVSKVIVNGETQMDVTSDTVVANKLAEGYTAHRNDGVQITGTMSGGGGGGGGLTAYTQTNLTIADDTLQFALPTGTTLSDLWDGCVAYLTNVYIEGVNGDESQYYYFTCQKMYVYLAYYDEYGVAYGADIEQNMQPFGPTPLSYYDGLFWMGNGWYDSYEDASMYIVSADSFVIIK